RTTGLSSSSALAALVRSTPNSLCSNSNIGRMSLVWLGVMPRMQYTIASLLCAIFWCSILVFLLMHFPQTDQWQWWLAGPTIGAVGGCLVACFTRRRVMAVLIGLASGVALQALTIATMIWLLRGVP